MPQDPVGQEMSRLLNDKLDQVIAKQDEHSIAIANHTASIHRVERKLEGHDARFDRIEALLQQLLDKQTD